ncbi:MAG: DUF2279 domain-containing protein [Actinomycetota bacterium]|nr:DUF2279 domain-containing protein [Actinomycetota bacterium]
MNRQLSVLGFALLLGIAAGAGPVRAADDATDNSAPERDGSATTPAVRDGARGWWATRTPDEKVLATNLGVIGFISGWGLVYWDYGTRKPRAESEGWFAQNTTEGGADKTGHLYTGYVLGRGFSGLFRRYGYDERKVARAGAISSLVATTWMEVGDSFSAYGFSHEDMAMNAAGAGAAWLLAANPSLDAKFALRGEFDPFTGATGDLLTDYEVWRYYATVKLDGFARMPQPLRWIELHAGYYARGYHDADPANNRRYTFVGVGLSLTKMARALGWQRTATFLDYYQPPGTVARNDDQQ